MLDPTERPAATARPRIAATLILASVGAFVTSLDVVVVSTALPSLRARLGASLSDLEWTINAYNLAFAALMLTGAAPGDRFALVWAPVRAPSTGWGSAEVTGALLGGAVLAAVFTANGGYASPATFMHAVRAALLVAGGVALIAVIPSLFGPSRAAGAGAALRTAAAQSAPPRGARQARGSSRSS